MYTNKTFLNTNFLHRKLICSSRQSDTGTMCENNITDSSGFSLASMDFSNENKTPVLVTKRHPNKRYTYDHIEYMISYLILVKKAMFENIKCYYRFF